MRLRAGCELLFESEQESPVVMMLRARPRAGQLILDEKLRISPDLRVASFVDVFGNRCARLVVPKGPLHVRTELLAEVAPGVAVQPDAPRTPVAKLPDETLHFTLPSRYCPADKLAKLAREVTAKSAPGYAEVQAIRDFVYERLAYVQGASDASTDAVDTLQREAGVCRDFAHVAIALCRAIDIPARMVVGYLHALAPMDLHAWFEAYVGGRWYTFDPIEDQLLGGRVILAYGRDAADVAFITDYGALRLTSMNVWVHEAAAAQMPQVEPLRRAG